MNSRVAALLACLLLALVSLAGCGWTATDLPLPGGGLSGPSYEVQAQFTDVLNLPQKARVSMNGVVIGQVGDIEAKGYVATVTMRILDKFRLPQGTTFQLRQATALGEVFIAVQTPAHPGTKFVRPGDVVPVDDTGAAPSIEDTLAALSTLLNGGGLNEIRTIVDELNRALGGHVGATRHLIHELTATATVLHSRSKDIDRILVSMDGISRRAAANEHVIDGVISATGPAVRQLRGQTRQFIQMLARFDSLARVGRRLVTTVDSSAVRMFTKLTPVLNGFTALNGKLAPTMRQMMTVYRSLLKITRGSTAAATIDLHGVLTDVGLRSSPRIGGSR